MKKVKVIDVSKIKVGDVVQTWNDDREFMILSIVDSVGKENGEHFVVVEEHSNRCFLKDINAHYVLVSK